MKIENRAVDDRTGAALRGPVKVCRTDTTVFLGNCDGNTCRTEAEEQTHGTITHYHLDGRIAQSQGHNPDGSEWMSTYIYDGTGHLREIETRDAAGSVSKSISHYDQRGRLQSVVVRAADGTETTVQTFSYDDQQKTRTEYLHSTQELPDSAVMHGVEGSDLAVSAPGATSIRTVYDDQDRPLETVILDSLQRVLSRVTLRYDAAGRLGEEICTAGMEKTLPPDLLARLSPTQVQSAKAIFGVGEGGPRWKRLHRYDAQGRRVETVLRLGGLGGERETMAYNEQGDVSEEKSLQDAKELRIDDHGRIVERSAASAVETPSSEARYSYQYDQHGNWIERVISSRQGPDKPFTVSSVDRRSLTYYAA